MFVSEMESGEIKKHPSLHKLQGQMLKICGTTLIGVDYAHLKQNANTFLTDNAGPSVRGYSKSDGFLSPCPQGSIC